jgi:hypothetical protein
MFVATQTETVGGFSLSGVQEAARSGIGSLASGGSASASLSAAGSVFGPVGSLLGSVVGGLFGGPCPGIKQNPKPGVDPTLTAAQAEAWAQQYNPNMIQTYLKCVSHWNNISFQDFVAWHYKEYRRRYPVPPSAMPKAAPAPAPAPAAVAQPAGYAPVPVAYRQPAASAQLVSYGQPVAYQDPAAERQRIQREEYRRMIDQRLAEFRAALSNAQMNYQLAYQSGNTAGASAWAGYYNQVSSGISQLESQRLQYL